MSTEEADSTRQPPVGALIVLFGVVPFFCCLVRRLSASLVSLGRFDQCLQALR